MRLGNEDEKDKIFIRCREFGDVGDVRRRESYHYLLATLYAVKMVSTSRRTRRDEGRAFAMRTDYQVRTSTYVPDFKGQAN